MGLNPGFLLSEIKWQVRNLSSEVDSSSVQSFLVTLASVFYKYLKKLTKILWQQNSLPTINI